MTETVIAIVTSTVEEKEAATETQTTAEDGIGAHFRLDETAVAPGPELSVNEAGPESDGTGQGLVLAETNAVAADPGQDGRGADRGDGNAPAPEREHHLVESEAGQECAEIAPQTDETAPAKDFAETAHLARDETDLVPEIAAEAAQTITTPETRVAHPPADAAATGAETVTDAPAPDPWPAPHQLPKKRLRSANSKRYASAKRKQRHTSRLRRMLVKRASPSPAWTISAHQAGMRDAVVDPAAAVAIGVDSEIETDETIGIATETAAVIGKENVAIESEIVTENGREMSETVIVIEIDAIGTETIGTGIETDDETAAGVVEGAEARESLAYTRKHVLVIPNTELIPIMRCRDAAVQACVTILQYQRHAKLVCSHLFMNM